MIVCGIVVRDGGVRLLVGGMGWECCVVLKVGKWRDVGEGVG